MMKTKIESPFMEGKILGQILDEAVATCPDNDAIIYTDSDYHQTWREFVANVDQIAKGLMAMGIRKGEKIAIWANNVQPWVEIMLAVARIGAILIPVNTRYRIEDIRYLLAHSECETLAIIDGYLDYSYVDCIYTLIPELRISNDCNISNAEFPNLRRVIYLGLETHQGMISIADVKQLSESLSDEAYAHRKAEVKPDDVVLMPYTSGTTGKPKGVMLTHTNIGLNGYWIGENQNLSEKDKICIPLPLFHSFGCVVGIMTALTHTSTMIILETFNPLKVMSTIEQEACTAIYGVPTMFLSIVEHKYFTRFNFSTLRTGAMAGSICPETLVRRVINDMHVHELTILYGLTEVTVMTQTRANDGITAMTTTVGKALPRIEVKCIDPKTGEDSPVGEQGEICCRGYNVMSQYYKMPEATRECIDHDGWLHSGDLGSIDKDGYLRVTGRMKDMIISGGENIYPKEIEDYILTVPGVMDAQVVGIPSRRYGEEVCAFVIPKEGKKLLPTDIRYFLRDKIAIYKIPKYISFVKEYPLTANGKVQKFRLREIACELFSKFDK